MSLKIGILLPTAIVAAIAASPLCPTSLRDTGLILLGMLLVLAFAALTNRGEHHRGDTSHHQNEQQQHTIQTIEQLRDILPAGASGTSLSTAKKVIGYLDDQMISFIAKSPLLYLATVNINDGMPFVSPKGDEPGFVTVLTRNDIDDDDGTTEQYQQPRHTLVIPDRPGNRLLFGLQNILPPSSLPTNRLLSTLLSPLHPNPNPPRASILFEVPGTSTTLRCGGTARISTSPTLLRRHAARGLAPKLVILVDVDHAFFHCAKAYMRGKVWETESWLGEGERPRVGFGRYFVERRGGEGDLERRIDEGVEKHYEMVRRAIGGEGCESEG